MIFTPADAGAKLISIAGYVDGLEVNTASPDNLGTVALTVGVGATLLSASSVYPVRVILTNVGGATIYLGDSGVTSATGIPLEPGQTFSEMCSTSLHGIASANTPVRRMQLYKVG